MNIATIEAILRELEEEGKEQLPLKAEVLTKGQPKTKKGINRELVHTNIVPKKNFSIFNFINKGCQYYTIVNRDLIEGLRLLYISNEEKKVK